MVEIEIDKKTKAALLEYLRIYGARNYESEVAWLCLHTLVALGQLAALVYTFGEHRYFKLALFINVKLCWIAAIALHWEYRAKCTDKQPCQAYVQYEWTGFLNMCAFIGLLPWLFSFATCIVQLCAIGTAHITMTDFGPVCRLFGKVKFEDGGIQDMLSGLMPLTCISAAVCAAVRVPGVVCMLQCIRSYQALLSDVLVAVCILTSILMYLYVLVLIVECSGCCGNIRQNARTVFRDTMARSKFVAGARKTMSLAAILPPTTGFKADKHNVAAMPFIAEAKAGALEFTRRKMRASLLTHFTTYCTVDGRNATEDDIKSVFADANVVYDDNGSRLFLVKELTYLKLLK